MKLTRVRLMASGDPAWDLSPNDLAALRHVLDELNRLQSDADAMAEWRERANGQFETNRVLRDELGRLRTVMDADERRLAWLAGCGSDDGPVIEGFAMLLDDFWSFLGDAIRERIGEENDSPDVEGTDGDKLTAFRAMVDSAIAAEKARTR